MGWRRLAGSVAVVGVVAVVVGVALLGRRGEEAAPAAVAVATERPAAAARASATVAPSATATVATGEAVDAPMMTPTLPADTATPVTSTPTDTATPSPVPTTTADPSPTTTPDLSPTSTPQGYLSRYRLVSYYGSAEGAGMGVLNFREEEVLLAELRERADEYQILSEEREVLPAFHVIVTIADPWFGEDRNFNHRASREAIEAWLALAEAQELAVVLDIQPGHAPVQEEFERIERYLYHPHVHLALDSEYTMEITPDGLYEIPGEVLGSLYGEQINPIQARLEEIALEIGVNKVLIVHQFEDEMVPDKENIEDYAHVELVIDSDGWGGPDKVRDYEQYAGEPGFEYGGIKLYRNWDNPLLRPEDVMGLELPPAVIIYQ